MAKRTPPEGTQSVVRALRLLKAFSRRRPDMTLAELCDELELTKTTAHRLLSALESEGLVARNPVTSAYRLGPAVIAMGARALQSHDLRALVQPELEALAAETGETVTLEVPAEDRVLILSEVSGGQHLVTVTAHTGTLWPLHATSTGKAMLAALPEARRSELLRQPLTLHTEKTITDPMVLQRELAEVRDRGYATAIEELEVGAAAVAAVIADPLGNPLGAISVGGPIARLPRRQLASLGKRLVEVTDRLSRHLERGG